jgi:hypothetical protein
LPHLKCIKLSPETTFDLRVVVTMKADGSKILWFVVGGILINMLNLDWPPTLATYTACSVRSKEN